MYIIISMAAGKQFNKIQHNFIINTFDNLIGKTKKKKKRRVFIINTEHKKVSINLRIQIMQ